MFLADMVVGIPVLEEKAFRMDFACLTMYSIIKSGILMYDTECNVDLVLSLSALMFHFNAGLCSPASCACSVYVTRSDSIFLNSLSH